MGINICVIWYTWHRNAHTNHEITSRQVVTRSREGPKDHTAGGNEKPYLPDLAKTRILKSRLISQKKEEEVHDPYFNTIPML